MNADDLPTPLHFSDTPSTVDQLGNLCRAQQKRIASLVAERETLVAMNGRLSGELLEASQSRATALVSLQQGLSKGRELCHRLVGERDTVLKALRAVIDVSERFGNGGTPTPTAEEVDRVYREAHELLKVIDQLQAQQAKQDAKKN